MAFQNLTPFPAVSWENVDAKKQWHISTIVRVKYVLHPTRTAGKWELRLTPAQGDLRGDDKHFLDNNNYPIQYETDFVTYKPNTDIVINGVAQSAIKFPNIKEECRVFVANTENKMVANFKQNLFGHNPWDKAPDKTKYPTGFGFINRASKSRLAFAGTYNDNWIDKQHPYPPHDFDYFYNQAAHPKLILKGYISAAWRIGLHNLISETGDDGFILPELHCFSEIISPTGQVDRTKMNMDTLLIDIDNEDKTKWAVYVSYRSFVPKLFKPKATTVKYLPVEILEKQHGR